MENRTRENVNEQSVNVESNRAEEQRRTRMDQIQYEEQGKKLD